MKHWLSQIKLGEWFSNAQYNYRPRNDKERKLMHDCYEEGYNNGYEEGKPKWHEIESHVTPSREIEKQYMPKNGEKVLLKYHFYNDEEIHYSDGYYDNYDFEFHIPNNPTGRIICVIAWCELSKFEE